MKMSANCDSTAANQPRRTLYGLFGPGRQNVRRNVKKTITRYLKFWPKHDSKFYIFLKTEINEKHKKKTNFGALSLYEREGWIQIDVNSYWTTGEAWLTQTGIKLLAYVSPEKFAFPWEVFLKICLIFVYPPVLKELLTLTIPYDPFRVTIPCDHTMWPSHVTHPI